MAKKGSPVMAFTLAFGPVLLVLVGIGTLLAWLVGEDHAKGRARQFLAKASHMHLEDRELAWEEFKRTDPTAAKFINTVGAGKGVRLII